MPVSKKILFLLILFIIVAGIFVFLNRELKERELKVSIIGDDIDLVRVGMFGQKADFGFVKVPFLTESDTLKFLNVAVDLNNDQSFAIYEVNGQTQPEWLVQNMPVKFIDGENSFSFFFPDKTVDDAIPAEGLVLRAVLSRDLINVSDWDGSIPQETDSKDIRIKIIAFEDVGDLLSPAPGKIGNFGFLYSDGYINFIEPAFAATDTVDVFHPNVPDINQKKNECVPTSAANSLLWLAKKFEFEDKLPSQDELIGELKNDMNWQAGGIVPEDFLKGKEKITERRKLPLINHEVGQLDGSTTFDKIAEELKKEQDVEMVIQFKDADGKTIGGHCVTVVGVMRLPSGTEIIHIHDPGTPGPALMEAYRLDKTDMGVRIVNYPYGRAYVSFAVSESYVKPVPPAPAFPIPPAPETPVTPEPVTPKPEEETPVIPEPETPAPLPPAETSTINITPSELVFEHQMGISPCPQEIGVLKLSKSGSGAANTWKLQNALPIWLAMEQSGDIPEDITLSFKCMLTGHVTQEVSTFLNFVLTDSTGSPVGETEIVTVTGHISAE